MPRLPEVDGKAKQLIAQAKTVEEEEMIKAFKQICIRNNLKVRDELFSEIQGWLFKHHWPSTDGHSQFQLTEFKDGVPSIYHADGCSVVTCGKRGEYVVFQNGVRVLYCERHFWGQPLRGRKIKV